MTEAVAISRRLSVLTSVSELYATKRIRRDRKTDRIIKTNFSNETWFRCRQVELSGFGHLCRILDALTSRSFSLVIRGEPLPKTDLNRTRKVNHADAQKGYPAAFAEAARHWFAVDLDKIKCPVAIDPVTDPEGAVEHLVGLLPPELHDGSCWWQFTCCQNLPGYEDTLSARLWFWLTDPLDGPALTRWARAANKAAGLRLIDDSLYRVVQVHYVAAPIFEDGMRDPLPHRHGVRVGLDEAVSLVIPEPAPHDPENYVAGGFVGVGVDGFVAQIGGAEGFRKPMVAAIASYYATNGANAAPGPIKARVREAIGQADPGGRSDADIARYSSDRHLDEIIAWVRGHERTKPVSVNPSPAELATAIAIGDERQRALHGVLRHLLRQRYLDPHLAVTLAHCFNQARCSPPLPDDEIEALAAAIARQKLTRPKR
jgi:hypothetical protein